MNNEEKILSMLESLTSEVKEIRFKVDKLDNKVDNLETRFDKLEAKVDKLEDRMIAAEKQTAYNMNFLLEEFERSDRRILSYLTEITLNKAGEEAKAALRLT